ncbi:MAG: hypothetical protein WCE79_02305 [Xanthobacteraceae bacterium]
MASLPFAAIKRGGFSARCWVMLMRIDLGRGLFRTWVVLSVLWAVVTCVVAGYGLNRDIIAGRFQAVGDFVGGKTASQVDWNLPFYDVIRSPSREKLPVTYVAVDYRQRGEWDTSDRVIAYDYPDRSRMYVQVGYDDADRSYIREQFWQQRFGRWGKAIGIFLALITLPPALLFLIGFTLLWIGRGFVGARRTA